MDKYSDFEYRLSAEGEGYAIKHYYGRNIEHSDEILVKLWAEAYDKLIELEDYISKKSSEEENDDYDDCLY